MQRSIHRVIAVAACACASVAGVAACSGSSGGTIADVPPSAEASGTTRIDAAHSFGFAIGHLDARITSSVRVFVNGAERPVTIQPDHSFALREVPLGDLHVTCVAGGASGSVVVPSVQPGEQIDLDVSLASDVVLAITADRSAASQPPEQVTTTTPSTLEITASNACYAMPPGMCGRDVVVTGDHVDLVGATPSCDDTHSVLTGSLTIHGNDCSVVDVDLRGSVVVTGTGTRFEDGCSQCWSDTCTQGDDGSGHGNGNGHGNGHGKKGGHGKGHGGGHAGHGHGDDNGGDDDG